MALHFPTPLSDLPQTSPAWQDFIDQSVGPQGSLLPLVGALTTVQMNIEGDSTAYDKTGTVVAGRLWDYAQQGGGARFRNLLTAVGAAEFISPHVKMNLLRLYNKKTTPAPEDRIALVSHMRLFGYTFDNSALAQDRCLPPMLVANCLMDRGSAYMLGGYVSNVKNPLIAEVATAWMICAGSRDLAALLLERKWAEWMPKPTHGRLTRLVARAEGPAQPA